MLRIPRGRFDMMDGRVSNPAQLGSVRRYTLSEGKARGVEVIDCDNGRIRFLLNVSKALDVMQLYHEGQNVSFLSKNAFTADNGTFDNRFEGGMIYTCGLDNAGRREGYVQHGRLHTLPCEILRAECSEQEIVVEGIVRDTALYGQNLVLRRKYTAKLGEGKLTLEDTLVNEAFLPAEYCLLYHVNLGYPLLDAGARLSFDAEAVDPCNELAKDDLPALCEVGAPVPEEKERCYYLALRTPEVALCNEARHKKFLLRYSQQTLPRFLLWKSFVSGDYALGLEPCTSQIGSRLVMQPLAPGEQKQFRLELSIESV